MPQNVKIQVRRGTASEWTASTSTPYLGEPCYDTSTGKTVIGDGESLFDELPDIRDQFQTIVTVRKTGKGKFSCANPAYSTDAECIQAALDHISSLGGGVLHIEKGHYICNSQLLYTGSNLYFEGDGENTILDFTGAASGLWCIYIHGSITETNSVLAVDANVSERSVTVSTGDGGLFSQGDWIRVRSEELFIEWDQTQHIAELQQIQSITGDVISLTENLFQSYKTIDTAKLDKMNLIENINVSSIKIIATNLNNNFGIVIANTHNVSVKNVMCEDVADRGIYLLNVVSAKIIECVIKRSNRASLGYGIMIADSSRDINVISNQFYDCRHAVACSVGSDTYGVQYGQIYALNTMSTDSRIIGMFGPHPTYDGLLIMGNTCNGCGLGIITGKNTNVCNNIIRDVSNVPGIMVTQDCQSVQIYNNTISTINSYGIEVRSVNPDIVITNNNIASYKAGIYSEYGGSNLKINHNTIKSLDYGIYIRDLVSSITSNTDISISHNNINSILNCIYISPMTNDMADIKLTYNELHPPSTLTAIIFRAGANGLKTENVFINGNHIYGGKGLSLSNVIKSKIKLNTFDNCITGITIQDLYTVPSDDYTIMYNDFFNCSTCINDVVHATTRKISNNDGYVTENTGTATITASSTSIVVSHGLVAAPTKIIVTPFGNVGNCWVDPASITATQMTIHCSSAPEADTVVSWSAQVV